MHNKLSGHNALCKTQTMNIDQFDKCQCIRTHKHTCTHILTCTCSHMDMHIPPHGHAHTHTQTHTNTYMPTAAKLLIRDHHMRWGWNSFSWVPGLVHCRRSFERLPSAAKNILPEPSFSADSLTTSIQPRVQSHAVTTACTIKLKLW